MLTNTNNPSKQNSHSNSKKNQLINYGFIHAYKPPQKKTCILFFKANLTFLRMRLYGCYFVESSVISTYLG